jgi:hypothetical protein
MAWPFGRRRLRPVAYPASAGTWRAAGTGLRKLQPPPTDSILTYTGTRTVDIGSNGTAPTAVFGADGTARAQVGPAGTGASWSLDQAAVSTSIGPLDPAACALFVGPLPLPNYLVAPTLAGGGSQFGLGGVGLVPGLFVWAVWTGGTPGATAQLGVTGQQTVLVQ